MTSVQSVVDATVTLMAPMSNVVLGAPGDPASDLTLDVTIAAGDAPLTLGLFEYTDVDLFNSFETVYRLNMP